MKKRTRAAVEPTTAQLVKSAFPGEEFRTVVYLRRIAISCMSSTSMTEKIGTRDAASKLDSYHYGIYSHSDIKPALW
jgi:hypothetical protein